MVPLVLGSLVVGYTTKSLYIGVGSSTFSDSLTAFNPHLFTLPNCHFLPLWVKLVPTLCSCALAGVSIFLYNTHSLLFWAAQTLHRSLHALLTSNMHFNYLQNKLLVPIMKGSYSSIFTNLDKGLLEHLGPFALQQSIKKLTTLLLNFQNRSVYDTVVTLFLTLYTCFILGYVAIQFFWNPFYQYTDIQLAQTLGVPGYPAYGTTLTNCCFVAALVAAIFCFWVPHNKPIISLGCFIMTIIPNIVILFVLHV